MKIVIISHTFTDYKYTKRWELLANKHSDLDVTLLSPKQFIYGKCKHLTFGNVEIRKGKQLDKDNFHIKLFELKNSKYFEWTSKDMVKTIKEIKPDLIYHIGFHRQESLMQIIKYKKYFNTNVKLLAFSMRGPHHNISELMRKTKKESGIKKMLYFLQYIYERDKLKKFNKYCDVVFCHYPDAFNAFKKEGFKKPIYIQTQIGVDTDIFYKDENKRNMIRKKYDIKDEFLFMAAIRFTKEKGVYEIINAFPVKGKWKLMLMGSGTEKEVSDIKKIIKKNNLEDKIILPGFIDRDRIADYWNAADCAIHFPQTSSKWIETFSLSLVQAMATKLAVIGNNSGSVPYQIGPDGIIIEEKNISMLHDKIQWAINNPSHVEEIGEKLFERTISSFSIQHLDNLFYETICDIYEEKYDRNKIDMADTTVK